MSFFYSLLTTGGVYSFYPSTDKATHAGIGPAPQIGYLAFGDIDNDPDDPNIMYSVWYLSSDHNSTPVNSSIIMYRSLDGGGTWSAQFTVQPNNVGYNITNPTVQVIKSGANKGRVIVNWSKQRGPTIYESPIMGGGPSDSIAIYSDDIKSIGNPASATWSSSYKLYPDFGEKLSTSSTSINLTSVTVSTNQNITIGTGLTNIWVGRKIGVISNSDTNKYFIGTIVSYNSGSGATVISVTSKLGGTTHSDWNVILNNYADSCGKAITLPDNSLLKVMHWGDGAGYLGYVFSSTDGITWTYKSTVWTLSSDPGNSDSHEAQLGRNPLNGDIWCIRRNGTEHFLIYSISSDAGSTWGTRVITSVPNQGKPPFTFTDRGGIVGIGRGGALANARTTIWQSSDRETFTWDWIDGREDCPYMYGGVVKMPTKVIATWAIEAHNTPVAFQGPNLIIQKDIYESATPIAPPTIYDQDYQSWLDFGQGNAETIPADPIKIIDNTLVAGLRSNAILTELDHYFIFEYNNAALGAITKRSWRQPWLITVPVASPTYAVDGYRFNGTTQVMSLNFLLSNAAKFVQNSASVFYYTPTNTSGEIYTDFGESTGTFSTLTTAVVFRPRNSSNQAHWTINEDTAGSTTTAGVTDSSGSWMLQRSASNAKALFRNGASLATSTNVSTGKGALELRIGAGIWSAGSVNQYSPRTFGCITVGSALVGKEAILHTLFATRRTALGL